ncbi:recombinase family protein [Lachnospiraceae bacterium OttesenSCG-928-D06]|nr:recombinase family protein [Lachnospiraceae bacterium OttesenSCG-928-D06]
MIALYLRWSLDDTDLMDESNSITNQRELLKAFIEERDYLTNCKIAEYVDDGYSGKNFERPGVEKLFDDIRRQKIKYLLVKDFSRLGRDYLEVGNYIEKIFPFFGVRFISVNNNFDSKDFIGTTPEIDVPFQNLLYDYYSEETSAKVKNAQTMLRKDGKFLATRAPFGYIKDPSDKNKLIVDREAAKIIKHIFELAITHSNKTEIARILNKEGVPTRSKYFAQKGDTHKWHRVGDGGWCSAMVCNILSNQEYLGHTVSGKVTAAAVGSKKVKRISKEEWLVVRNTHEPLISEEIFWRVNQVDNSNGLRPKPSKEKQKPPLNGFVRCTCGRSMALMKGRVDRYYCKYAVETKSDICVHEKIDEKRLCEIVLAAIQNQGKLADNFKQFIDFNHAEKQKRENKNEKERSRWESEINHLKEDSIAAYEEYKEGRITRERYMQIRKDNTEVIEKMQSARLNSLLVNGQAEDQDYEYKFLDAFGGKGSVDTLTSELVGALIEKIRVFKGGRVEVEFRFADELISLL